MDSQPLWILVSAWVTGGLAGATLTIIYQWLRQSWLKPRLEILFANKEPGCRVDTNIVGGTQNVARYLRLKVKNSGRSTAHDVSVCVTKLTFTAPGAGSHTFRDDVLDLKLTLTPDTLRFRLAPCAHRYIDLAHTDRSGQGANFIYDFAGLIPARLERLRQQGVFGTQAGEFGAEIFVSAEKR